MLQIKFMQVQILTETKNNFPSINFKSKPLKNIIRLSVLCIPLALIIAFGPPDKNPQLTGKYEVTNLVINQKKIAVNSCQDSVLTIIYFDQGNDIVFEYNNQKRNCLNEINYNYKL